MYVYLVLISHCDENYRRRRKSVVPSRALFKEFSAAHTLYVKDHIVLVFLAGPPNMCGSLCCVSASAKSVCKSPGWPTHTLGLSSTEPRPFFWLSGYLFCFIQLAIIAKLKLTYQAVIVLFDKK